MTDIGYVGLDRASPWQVWITLRPAEMADEAWLLRIRNDRETRRQSVRHERIARGQHHAWLRKTLAAPDTLLFVVEANGTDVGSVRLDGKIRVCEVSLALDRTARGEGLMEPLIAAIMAQARQRGYKRMRAEVRQNNAQSLRGFLRAGFVPTSDELMTLEVDL